MLTKIASRSASAIALRTDSGTKISVERVITVRNPARCKSFCRRNAVSSATVFSGTIWPGIPPESEPPCPGSMTTVENEFSARHCLAVTAKAKATAVTRVCRKRIKIPCTLVKVFFPGRLDSRFLSLNRHRSEQEGRAHIHHTRSPRLRADQDEHLVRDFACSPAVALAYKPDTGLGSQCRPDGALYRDQRRRSFRFASRLKPVLRAVAAYIATA